MLVDHREPTDGYSKNVGAVSLGDPNKIPTCVNCRAVIFSFHLGAPNQLITRLAGKFGESTDASSETINVAQDETSVAILAHKEFSGVQIVPMYLICELDIEY